MTLDEKTLSEVLRAIEVNASPDLAARARTGGRRRLLRRRSLTAVGAVAVGAAAAPVTLAVRAGVGHHSPTFKVAASPTATDSGLYAAPPPAGSECNSGYGAKVSASAHADLLLLPPADQQVRYAYIRDQTSNCAYPHVALTAVQEQGGSLGSALMVQGPNAPTAIEDGRQAAHAQFFGETGYQPIDGQPATEYTLPRGGRTDAYWTEPDGSQWHALVRDMAQSDAVALLNRLVLNGHDGTAVLPGTAAKGWTIEAPVADRSDDQSGWVTAQWNDPQGHLVDLTVTQTPDRTLQSAVENAGQESIITVRGHEAVLSPTGGNGGNAYGLVWQEAKDVQVALALTGGSAAEIEQVAESLTLASPDDPRINVN